MANRDDLDLIKITHYINPHMFWYKYEDTFVRNVELSKWEYKLQQYFANRPPNPTLNFRPQIDEVVAVFNFSLNRWIRAKCDEINEYMISTKNYVVWAIDYGIPFQSEGKWIRRLPREIKDQPEETVHFGGIKGIIPAEKEFNFETFQSELKPAMKWSTLAVRTIENFIFEAAHIRFIRHIVSKDGQFFGNLEFTTHTNCVIKADASLLEMNHAIATNDFLRIIRQISTNKIPRWQMNDNTSFVSKYYANKMSNFARLEPREYSNGNHEDEGSIADEEVNKKIADWTKRNEICQMQDNGTVADDARSVCESTVSVKITRQLATKQLLVEQDDSADIPVMLRGGACRRKQLEKYKESIPPPPSTRECGHPFYYFEEHEEDKVEGRPKSSKDITENSSECNFTQIGLYDPSANVIKPFKPTIEPSNKSKISVQNTVLSVSTGTQTLSSDSSSKSEISNQASIVSKSAESTVINRLMSKRKILQNMTKITEQIPTSKIIVPDNSENLQKVTDRGESSKPVRQKQPVLKVTTTVIPAGFDLRNLQPTKSFNEDYSSAKNRFSYNENNHHRRQNYNNCGFNEREGANRIYFAKRSNEVNSINQGEERW